MKDKITTYEQIKFMLSKLINENNKNKCFAITCGVKSFPFYLKEVISLVNHLKSWEYPLEINDNIITNKKTGSTLEVINHKAKTGTKGNLQWIAFDELKECEDER